MKYILLTMGLGWAILVIPSWPLPDDGGSRSLLDSAILSLGYILAFGSPGALLLLILNRLINVSFDIHYGKNKHDK